MKYSFHLDSVLAFSGEPHSRRAGGLDIVRSILEGEIDLRFQDPELEQHGGFWRIRPYVRTIENGKLVNKRKSIPLGPCAGPKALTRSEALVNKQRVMGPINQRVTTVTASITFSELLDAYELGGMVDLKASTAAKYKSLIANWIRPAFGALPLSDIDRTAVQTWVRDMVMVRKREPSTAASARNCLSAIFSYAEDSKYWEGRNPCERVKIPRRPRDREAAREKRNCSMEELVRFLLAIEDVPAIITADAARLIARLAVTTTLRVGEILGLRWGDLAGEEVRIERRYYRGSVDYPKSEASERLVSVGGLGAELRLRRPAGARDTDYIFARGKKPLDDRQLQTYVFRPAAKRAGMYFRGFGMHQIRRIGITWRQTIGGAAPLEAMKAAGHTRLEMTALYTLQDLDRQRAQAGAVDQAITAATAEKTAKGSIQ